MPRRPILSFRANTLIGLVLIAPIVGTLLVVDFVVKLVTNAVMPEVWLASRYGAAYRLAALCLVVLCLYAIGLLARNFVGRTLYRAGDRMLGRIPVIRGIYTTIRQIGESLLSSQSNKVFKDVVAVRFPAQGSYSIGFVTAHTSPLAVPGDARELVHVFVPTAPNPTSGFLLLVPRGEVWPVDLAVTDAMKLIMSAGAVVPGTAAVRRPASLLDQLETWLHREEPPASPPAPGRA